MAKARGSVTIIDLTDSRTLIAYISSSNRRSVIYDPDTKVYLPNYSQQENVLSPELYIAGGGSNIISQAKSVKWTVQTNSMGRFEDVVVGRAYTFGADHALIIGDNILKDNLSMLFRVEIVYHDRALNNDILIQADIELVKLSNGSRGTDGKSGDDAVLLTIETPDGTTIRNSEGTLRAVSELYKGTSRISSGITYKWYKRRPQASGDTQSGTGWLRLDNSNNLGTTGFNSATLTIPPGAITSNATFMVIITYNGQDYKRQVTVDDITDPYSVAILGDSFFKNGKGQNTYTAKIYRNGDEIDSNETQGFTYTWHQYSSSGSMLPGFEKVGKTITISSSEFIGKSDLRVTVTR